MSTKLVNYSSSGTKGTWTEEQESELRFLFEENQRNPETDKGNYFKFNKSELQNALKNLIF